MGTDNRDTDAPGRRDAVPLTDPDFLSQPLAAASALPARCYVDPVFAKCDRNAIFARSWQFVAHAAALDAVGDHVVCEIAGVPLVLVRGGDGVLRVLHNVCRHRAGPLALCDGRDARRLTCRYHGWTYALDGQLLSAPEMDAAEAFDTLKIRLPQAHVAEWQGLVFAALDDTGTLEPPPEPSIAELVDGLPERLGERKLDDLKFFARVDYDIACNWKTYVDNFLEGYHLPHVHPELNRLLDYRSYVTETRAWNSLQWSPIEKVDSIYGTGEALYWFIWPNTMLNVLPGRMQTNRVIPTGPQTCRVVFDYYYVDAGQKAAQKTEDQHFSDLVQQQDIAICESVQRGLASGSYTAGRLNPKRESGVHHFHELLRRAYRNAACATHMSNDRA